MPGLPTLFHRFLLAAVFALGPTAYATGQQPAPTAGPTPLNPQPAEAALRPGLQMLYFHGDFRHVDTMPKTPAQLAEGKPGKTVANLAAISDTGKLWDIPYYELYGAHFTGLIKLAAGEYGFATLSNDGVRVTLDRMRIVDDPDIHADRFSRLGKVTIAKAGWYPITVQYFQRKRTASLELHWKPPGAGEASIVPPSALAHLPR